MSGDCLELRTNGSGLDHHGHRWASEPRQPNGGQREVSHYTPSGQRQAINPCRASTQPGSFRKSIKRVFTELCQIVMGI